MKTACVILMSLLLPVADAGIAAYEKLTVIGETARYGIYDPSLEYEPDGSIGWLMYSAIHGPQRPVGCYVSTHLAKTMDDGKTWTYVKEVHSSGKATLTFRDGSSIPGAWRYEVPSLVFDPLDKGKEWKLFTHKYFWNPERDRMPAYGWISYKYSADPELDWSEEIPLFGAGRFPLNPYATKFRINEMDPFLSDFVAYSEPGALVHDGVLYLSLTALRQTGPEKIILLASSDHAETWRYVGALLDRNDAKALGYKSFDASSLAVQNGRVFLMASPARKGIQHDGTYILEFAKISEAKLRRDATGKPVIHKRITPHTAFVSERGAGQSDFHAMNKHGGILMPQVKMSDYPEVFQIFQTNVKIQ